MKPSPSAKAAKANLADLERALRADAWNEAFDAIRTLWASHRSLALSELAELVSRRLELTVPALPKGKRDVMQREWLAAAAKKRAADEAGGAR